MSIFTHMLNLGFMTLKCTIMPWDVSTQCSGVMQASGQNATIGCDRISNRNGRNFNYCHCMLLKHRVPYLVTGCCIIFFFLSFKTAFKSVAQCWFIRVHSDYPIKKILKLLVTFTVDEACLIFAFLKAFKKSSYC